MISILTMSRIVSLAIFLGLFVVPYSALAATASITATPNSSPLYTGGTVTVSWSSSGAFRCVGTNFNTANATSGTVTVTAGSAGTKTYSVACYDDTPSCSLVETSSFIEDASGQNNCNSNINYSPSGSCYPKNATCQSSVSTGQYWRWTNYQCQGSCSTAVASDSVTVNNPPPPPDPNVVLTASPSPVIAGNSVLLSWTSDRATSCTGVGFSTGGETDGSVSVTPTEDTTYSITCNSEVYSSTPGTYEYAYRDVTDLWCTEGPPQPNYSNYYTENQCPGNSDPTGDACVGSETCAVNSWSGGRDTVGGNTYYCNLISDVYRCNGGSAPNQITDSVSVIYNQRPNRPTINGPTTGVAGVANAFTFQAVDPDSDQVRYRIDWNDDGTYDQSSSYGASNWLFSTNYTWSSPGTYTFKARTNDILGAYSLSPTWQYHTITIGSAAGQCEDGIDNDGDGLIDLADFGCPNSSDPDESDNPQCSDGIDNDGDGLVDLDDFGCSGGGDTSESPNPQCSDGIDNNGNGKIDYTADPACSSSSDNNEETLADAVISLSATPQLTQNNAPVILNWSAENVQDDSCSLSGTNGDSWSLSGSSGNQLSSAITEETIFSLQCTDLNDDPVATSVTIKLVPSFREI